MSVNRYVSITAWGYDPAIESELMKRIEKMLRREMIMEFFEKPGRIVDAIAFAVPRLDGARMVICGSFRPAIIASPSHEHATRMYKTLLEACGPGGSPRVSLRLRSSDDELEDGSHVLNERVHAVECCLGEEIEALRGKESMALANELVAEYFALPSWDQRDYVVQLLCDLIGRPTPSLSRMWRDALKRPVDERDTYAHYTVLHALKGLAPQTTNDDSLEALPLDTLARVAARVHDGASVDAALAQG